MAMLNYRWWLASLAVHGGVLGLAVLVSPWHPPEMTGVTAEGASAEVSAHSPKAVATQHAVNDLQRRLREIRRVERALGASDQPAMPEGELGQDTQHLEAQLRATAARIEKLNDEQKERVWQRIQGQHLQEAKAPDQSDRSEGGQPSFTKPKLQTQSLDQLEKRAQDILFQAQAADKARQAGVSVSSGNVPSSPDLSGHARQSAPLDGRLGDRAGSSPGDPSRTGVVATNADGTDFGGKEPHGLPFGNQDRRQYAARLDSPRTDDTGRFGHARMLGSSGPFMSRLHIDAWYVLGPFAGHGPQAIDTPLPVELSLLRGPDLGQNHVGKNGKRLRWQWQSVARYPMVPLGAEEYAVYYGFTEIRSEEEQDVVLHLGADDDARVWLNGKQVWASGPAFKPWYSGHFSRLKESVARLNLTESTVKVRLTPGKNQLAFKLYNGFSATFISVVLTPAGP
jgi:hypothetical protein